MEVSNINGQNIIQSKPHHSQIANQTQHEADTFRQQSLKSIKNHFKEHVPGRIRHKQNIILYFINLSLPITLSCLNAKILLDITVQSQLTAYIFLILVAFNFIISLYTSLSIAPQQQVIKLFFHFDTMIPVTIAAIISFFSFYNFLSTTKWSEKATAICFPIWVIYYAGSLRVMIAYLDWARWEVLLYKTVVLSCALIFFYVGFTYMNGAYKITEGYLVSVEDTVKNMIYLYVFGIVELFFTYFRMLSEFDQTKDLKFEYRFQDQQNLRSKSIAKIQFQELERQVIEQDIKDAISVRQIEMNNVITQKRKQVIIETL